MIKKILKILALAQAVALPAGLTKVQRANELEPTQATNILYDHAIVDSVYISYPRKTDELISQPGWGYYDLLRLIPVNNKNIEINFIVKTIENQEFAYKGMCLYGDNLDFEANIKSWIDPSSNLKEYKPDSEHTGYFFGDVQSVPEQARNKNVLVKFREPMFVYHICPGAENFIFNSTPVDKFALTYNGLLNGYSYNLLGGREDIDKKRFREYIKNHVSLQTEGFWKSKATFTIATFKNGTEEFEIVGWVADYPNSTNVSIATNYKAKSIYGIKLLCGYIFNDSGEVISEATNSTNIDKYYTCTIVDETAAKYVLTGGPDFSYFLDYTKEIGFPYGYAKGYTDGQGNPTFKSFIVSAFEACGSFFALPILGQNITIGTLIGSFVGLGALFLLIKLFR